MEKIKNFYLKLLPGFSFGLLIYWVYEAYTTIKAGNTDRLFIDAIIIGLLFTSFASSVYVLLKKRKSGR